MPGIVWLLRWRILVVLRLLVQRPGTVLGPGLLYGFVVWIAMVAVADATRWGFWFPIALSLLAGILMAAWLGSGRIARHARRQAAADEAVVTERLVLRRPRRSDADAFAAAIDAEMMAANGWTASTRWWAIARMSQSDRVPVDYVTVIADRSTSALLGWISVSKADLAAGTCELGWSMAPHARNKGYSSEAIGAAFDALHRAGYAQITVGTAEENLPVRRVLERTGATLIRSSPHTLPNGSTIPGVWYVHRPDAPSPDAAEASSGD